MDGVRFISQLIMNERKLKQGKSPEQTDRNKKNEPKQSHDERIDVDKPLWNQDSYCGRWKYFVFITDTRTVLVPEDKLLAAKKLLEDYRAKKEPTDTTRKDIIYAKKLHDSAFHPDNGQLMNVFGRMSFQFPGHLFLTVGMLAFHKSTLAVVGWQVINQSFNALVNYTNRNGSIDSKDDETIIKQAYLAATTASCAAALGFRKILSARGPLAARWAPFGAVAVGNMINLPIMRQREISRGIPISPKENEKAPIMNSRIASVKAISECIFSRITMAAPGMILIPVVMNAIKPYCFYQTRPWIGLPIETALVAAFSAFMIPTALAIFPRRNSMPVPGTLKLCKEELEEYERKMKGKTPLDRVYYNKGL